VNTPDHEEKNRSDFFKMMFPFKNTTFRRRSISSTKKDKKDIKKAAEEYPLWIFHPHESIRLRWDILIAIVMFYLLLDIPLKICFEVDLPLSHPWSQAELAVDYLFMLDLLFNFTTGYVTETEFVTDRRRIAWNYLHGWFSLDLVTSMPFELVVGGGTGSVSAVSKVLKFARFIRLLKLLRILRLMTLISQWETSSSSSTVLLRLLKLFVMMFITAHLAACGWIGIAMFYRNDDHSWENFHGYNENSWFVRFAQTSPTWERKQPEQYLRALYWAFTTLATIGYGDITPVLPLEVSFTIFIEFTGSTLFGYIIGNVASVITHDDETVMLIKEKIATVKHFLAYRKVPEDLCDRIRRHYEYAWRRSQVFKEGEILAELPHSVMTDCALHIHQDIIKGVPFLKELGNDVVPSLVTRLKPCLASHGDDVLKEGLIGNEMFFILNGKLVVELLERAGGASLRKEKTIHIRNLEKGECFAEYAVFMEQSRHPANVTALAYCDMYMLLRHDFAEFGNDCPMAYADVLRQGKSRYLELITEIAQKQNEHLQQLMDKEKEENIIEQGFGQESHINKDTEEIVFKPGAIVSFTMRLKYQRQLILAEQNLKLNSPTRIHKLYALAVLNTLRLIEYFEDSKKKKEGDEETIEQQPLLIRLFPKSHTDACNAGSESKSEYDDAINCGSGSTSNIEMTKHRRSSTRSSQAVAKISNRMLIKIIAWKHRAHRAVATRHIEAVQKRHCDKFDIKNKGAHASIGDLPHLSVENTAFDSSRYRARMMSNGSFVQKRIDSGSSAYEPALLARKLSTYQPRRFSDVHLEEENFEDTLATKADVQTLRDEMKIMESSIKLEIHELKHLMRKLIQKNDPQI